MKTRTVQANEVFQHMEIFHSWQRRHSKLDYHTTVEHERLQEIQQPAWHSTNDIPENRNNASNAGAVSVLAARAAVCSASCSREVLPVGRIRKSLMVGTIEVARSNCKKWRVAKAQLKELSTQTQMQSAALQRQLRERQQQHYVAPVSNPPGWYPAPQQSGAMWWYVVQRTPHFAEPPQ
jgi:hypothetical protein